MRVLRENGAFRSLILATAFPAMAVQMVAGLFLYIITHVLGVDDQVFISSVFASYVLASVVSYPAWAMIARRWGKPFAFRAALFMMALS